MEVSADIAKDMVDYVEETSGLLSKHAAVQTELASRAPGVVDKLIKAGLLKESQRAAAELNAQDPLKLLDSLNCLASKAASTEKAAAEPESLGSPEEPKHSTKLSAEDRPARGTADKKFLEAFGLA
jgi:hypothetical protein